MEWQLSGVFVTFEGGEGSGKTTQVRLLANRLRAETVEVVETRDPGGTAIGKEIRDLLIGRESVSMADASELLLYEASRAQLVREVIRPAIGRGAVVLSDRFTDSTIAYQGFGRGLDLDLIRGLNQFVTGGLKSDLTVLLDLDPILGLERCTKSVRVERSFRDRIAAEPLAFHQRVKEGYLALARQESERIRLIDARLSLSEIEAAVWREFMRVKGSRLIVHG